MTRSLRKKILLIIPVLLFLAMYSITIKAEVINPTAKTGLNANGEKQVLIESGKLTDGDEVDRYYRYKFEQEDDAAYTKDADLIAAADAGVYLVEWQLISTKNGDENILDAGIVKTYIEEGNIIAKENANTGVEENNKLIVGIVAVFSAVIIILGAVVIRERMGR